jgi:hypothetical protein
VNGSWGWEVSEEELQRSIFLEGRLGRPRLGCSDVGPDGKEGKVGRRCLRDGF